MQRIIGEEKPSVEDLIHFGIKGMKWGVRRAENKAHRAKMRQLDQKSKERDRKTAAAENAKRNMTIDAARGRVKSGQTKQELRKAKAAFKTDKNVIGKREARKKLTNAREKYYAELDTANQVKAGKETAIAVIGLIGGNAISILAPSIPNIPTSLRK